eukprot:395723-Hanusia_phi.AAC.1
MVDAGEEEDPADGIGGAGGAGVSKEVFGCRRVENAKSFHDGLRERGGGTALSLPSDAVDGLGELDEDLVPVGFACLRADEEEDRGE